MQIINFAETESWALFMDSDEEADTVTYSSVDKDLTDAEGSLEMATGRAEEEEEEGGFTADAAPLRVSGSNRNSLSVLKRGGLLNSVPFSHIVRDDEEGGEEGGEDESESESESDEREPGLDSDPENASDSEGDTCSSSTLLSGDASDNEVGCTSLVENDCDDLSHSHTQMTKNWSDLGYMYASMGEERVVSPATADASLVKVVGQSSAEKDVKETIDSRRGQSREREGEEEEVAKKRVGKDSTELADEESRGLRQRVRESVKANIHVNGEKGWKKTSLTLSHDNGVGGVVDQHPEKEEKESGRRRAALMQEIADRRKAFAEKERSSSKTIARQKRKARFRDSMARVSMCLSQMDMEDLRQSFTPPMLDTEEIWKQWEGERLLEELDWVANIKKSYKVSYFFGGEYSQVSLDVMFRTSFQIALSLSISHTEKLYIYIYIYMCVLFFAFWLTDFFFLDFYVQPHSHRRFLRCCARRRPDPN